MMANDIFIWIMALLAGGVLGAFFFGGLWWTVQKGVSSRYPALWFLGSVLVRTGVVLAGFYFVADGNWERILACLLGFIVARFVVLRLKQQPSESKIKEP